MTYDQPPTFVPATPDYVLEVIRDSFRQECGFYLDDDPYIELTFNSTVDEWREACDLLPFARLGRVLNQEWGLGFSDSEWREVLEPSRKRNLRGVCELIAAKAYQPTIEPVTILSSACFSAGAFLAIRWILRENGADVDGLRPSTPLDQYTRRWGWVFIGPISRLAPNAIPRVRVHNPWRESSELAFAISFFATLLGALLCYGFSPSDRVTSTVLISTIGFFLLSLTALEIAARIPPTRVEFGDLRTFRDLSFAMADLVGKGRKLTPS